MKRLLLLVALAGVALLGSACDLTPPAATVNGQVISQGQLDDQLEAVVGNQAALCTLELEVGAPLTARGAGVGAATGTPSVVTTAFAGSELSTLILERLEADALAAHHATVSASDLSAAAADFPDQVETALSQTQTELPACVGLTSQSLKGLPKLYLDQRVRLLATQERLAEVLGRIDVSSAALHRYYTAHQSELTQVCLNLLVVNTQADAQRLHDQIAAGGSFSAAASDPSVSSESPPGGQVACVYPAQVEQQFGTSLAGSIDGLANGQLGPVLAWPTTDPDTGASQTLYLVVQMRQHSLVPFDQVESAIRQALLGQGSANLGPALQRIAARAHVSVNARYGKWNPRGLSGLITPPPTPARGLLLNPSANQPAGD